jgi:hypothetical protein
MDGGGGGGGANHMNKGIFKIFVEECLVVFPMAVIVTALSLLFCLTLPQSLGLRLAGLSSILGVIASLCTTRSKIRYMFRGFPYRLCQPEGKFAHFCIQLDYFVCNGVLMALGLIPYGAALKKLGIDFKPFKQEDDIMQHKAMLRTLSLETTNDKIAYFAAGIFCYNISSFCFPRLCIQIIPVLCLVESLCEEPDNTPPI